MKVVRLSALRTGRPYPQEIFLVLISVRGWIDPRVIVRPKGLCQWKVPVTPSEIEPATFRFVAQCLNHCATAYPITLGWMLRNESQCTDWIYLAQDKVHGWPGPPRAGSGPGEKKIVFDPPPPPSAGVRQLKNLYTKSERQTGMCRVAWARCDRVKCLIYK
jgi:hypothetical protein